MSLHRLTGITLGVPDVAATVRYYTEFGLIGLSSEDGQHVFGTVDGRAQLRIVHHPVRRLMSLGIGAADTDDLDRISRSLGKLDITATRTGDRLRTAEPISGLDVIVSVAPEINQPAAEVAPVNAPGVNQRLNVRAPAILRPGPVRPSKLGHVAIATTDRETSQRFFIDGLGFKVSDELAGRATFMRCSSDHHNVLVQQSPVHFLHHTSWQVRDVDEVGRGAKDMLEEHPERHVWGLGRHWVGSNFFYYLKDPAGNFSEYYSDMDCIVDDQLWEPGVIGPEMDPNYWGPPMPPSMIEPEDLAELMAAMH